MAFTLQQVELLHTQLSNKYNQPAQLEQLDNIGLRVFGDNFEDYFSGVSVSAALRMLLDDGKTTQEHVKRYYDLMVMFDKQMSKNIQEATMRPKTEFVTKAAKLLGEAHRDEIDFTKCRAALLNENYAIENDLYTAIRFTQDVAELKEAIEIATKTKIVLREAKQLNEAEDSVEYADMTQLFTDLTTANASLGEALSLVFTYKNQYVEDPVLVKAIAEVCNSISEASKKLNATIVMIGTKR